MRRLALTIAVLLLMQGRVFGAVPAAPPFLTQVGPSVPGQLTLGWDADDPSQNVTDYILYYGTTSGTYSGSQDAGLATQVTVTGLLPSVTYFFAVKAVNAAGMSPFSTEVSGPAPADPQCAFPLGAMSVSIFPTGKIGCDNGCIAGSKAYLTFQVGSPGSPVTKIAIQTGNVDISPNEDIIAKGDGDSLTALRSIQFTVPPTGTYPLQIFAANAYGCTHVQNTGLTLTVK